MPRRGQRATPTAEKPAFRDATGQARCAGLAADGFSCGVVISSGPQVNWTVVEHERRRSYCGHFGCALHPQGGVVAVCQSIDDWDSNGASDETIAVARKSYNELCREGMPHVSIVNDTVAAVGPYNTDLVPPARPSETAFTLAATLKVELDTRRALGLPSGTAVTLSAALPDEAKPNSVCYVYGTIRGAFVLTQAAGMLRRLMQAPGYELAASTTDSSNPPRLLIEVRARASEDDGESLTDYTSPTSSARSSSSASSRN